MAVDKIRKCPYVKKCACNMHVPTNYMHVMLNMHVTLLLHECYIHVVRVLEMVAHVPSCCTSVE